MIKWWWGRERNIKMEKYQKDITYIKQQQSLQLLELVRIALDGIQEIGTPKNEVEAANKDTFIKLFDDSIIELQRYASSYKSNDHCGDYELSLVEKSIDRQTKQDNTIEFPEKVAFYSN